MDEMRQVADRAEAEEKIEVGLHPVSSQTPCDEGVPWKRLRRSLMPIACRLARDDFAADDLASDIVLSALQKFANSGASSVDLLCWSRRIARPLAARAFRDATRRRLEPCPCLDDLCAPAWDSAVGAVEADDFAECLCARLGASDRVTLAFLRTGAPTNAEIARSQGISLASVERSRQRLKLATLSIRE